MKSGRTSSKIIKAVTQIAPLVIIAVCAAIYLIFLRGITAKELLSYTPENIWLAALMIIGLFGLKSLSIIFPMFVLVMTSGLISPNIWVALLINTLGTILMTTIPYLIGRYAERELVEGLLKKNKRLTKAREIRMSNETFFAYFLRVINILPYDVVSMYLGSTGCGWRSYYIGSLLGTIPGMICCTFTGMYAEHPTSPQFIISMAVNITISAASAIWYVVYVRRLKKH